MRADFQWPHGLHPFTVDVEWAAEEGVGEPTLTDEQIHTHIVSTTLAFAPEVKGLRAHSLLYDSTLLPLYRKLGLEYDCGYHMPLGGGFLRSSILLQGQRDSTWLASGSNVPD